MPSFDDIEVTVTGNITVDFEVYCDTCGHGLCMLTNTGITHNRRQLFLKVEVCPICIKEKNDEIDELKIKIKELGKEIEKY